jgi:hypothetical protein
MKPRHYRYNRLLRKVALVMAAMPLFQLAQCGTGIRQVSADMANSLPSTIFGLMQSFALAPIQALLSALFNTGA